MPDHYHEITCYLNRLNFLTILWKLVLPIYACRRLIPFNVFIKHIVSKPQAKQNPKLGLGGCIFSQKKNNKRKISYLNSPRRNGHRVKQTWNSVCSGPKVKVPLRQLEPSSFFFNNFCNGHTFKARQRRDPLFKHGGEES